MEKSSFYDFCFTIEANYHSLKVILSTTKLLEKIFFVTLYECQEEGEFFDFNFKINQYKPYFKNDKYNLSYPQKGFIYKIIYHQNKNSSELLNDLDEKLENNELCLVSNSDSSSSTEKNSTFVKEINLIDFYIEEKHSLLKYYVNLKKLLNNDIYSKAINYKLISQYEIVFEIQRLPIGSLLYVKIETHSSYKVASPFNNNFIKAFKKKLYKEAFSERYSSNFKTTGIAVVNIPKNDLVKRVQNINSKSYEYTLQPEVEGDNIINRKGIRFLTFIYKDVLKLEIIEYKNDYNNTNSDTIIGGVLLDSKPKYIKFTYYIIIKKISNNKSLFLFSHVFCNLIPPKLLANNLISVSFLLGLYKFVKHEDYEKMRIKNNNDSKGNNFNKYYKNLLIKQEAYEREKNIKKNNNNKHIQKKFNSNNNNIKIEKYNNKNNDDNLYITNMSNYDNHCKYKNINNNTNKFFASSSHNSRSKNINSNVNNNNYCNISTDNLYSKLSDNNQNLNNNKNTIIISNNYYNSCNFNKQQNDISDENFIYTQTNNSTYSNCLKSPKKKNQNSY